MAIGVAVNNARDLVNQPYNYMTAADLADYARELVAGLNNDNLSIRIYEKDEIAEMGMNAFLAVNKGSAAGPKADSHKISTSGRPVHRFGGQGTDV